MIARKKVNIIFISSALFHLLHAIPTRKTEDVLSMSIIQADFLGRVSESTIKVEKRNTALKPELFKRLIHRVNSD